MAGLIVNQNTPIMINMKEDVTLPERELVGSAYGTQLGIAPTKYMGVPICGPTTYIRGEGRGGVNVEVRCNVDWVVASDRGFASLDISTWNVTFLVGKELGLVPEVVRY